MLTALSLGFVLGLRHAFDPDHVIAVSALATRQRRPWNAVWLGASWGAGHAATICAVGSALIALRWAVPDSLALAGELGIGVLLVVLGIANLRAAGPRGDRRAEPNAALPLRRAAARSGLVGLAHGLAGSAAVALLALAAMPTPASALAYLCAFGAGTIGGMVAFTAALGAPFALMGGGPRLRRCATAAAGLASVAFGAYLIWHVGSGGRPPLT